MMNCKTRCLLPLLLLLPLCLSIDRIEGNVQWGAWAFGEQRICSDSEVHDNLYWWAQDDFDTRWGAESGICSDEFHTKGGIGKELLLCPSAEECGTDKYIVTNDDSAQIRLTDLPLDRSCIFKIKNDGADVFKFNLTEWSIASMRVELFLREDGPYDFIYEGSSVNQWEKQREISVPKQEELFVVAIPLSEANNFNLDILPIHSEDISLSFEVIIGIILAVVFIILCGAIISLCIWVNLRKNKESSNSKGSRTNSMSSESSKHVRKTKSSIYSIKSLRQGDSFKESLVDRESQLNKINQSTGSSKRMSSEPYYKAYKNN